jgi:tRNA splicing ligase
MTMPTSENDSKQSGWRQGISSQSADHREDHVIKLLKVISWTRRDTARPLMSIKL